jgi:large subunit ribosomal protein L15
MTIKLSNLKSALKSRHRKKRVGRGNNASDQGTYSGRGQKGQRARSGGKGGLKLRGLINLVKKFPKNRGFKAMSRVFSVVNIDQLEKHFENNETIDAEKLAEKGLIKKENQEVKILGQGKLNKKFIVRAQEFSKNAEESIKKAGGKAITI